MATLWNIPPDNIVNDVLRYEPSDDVEFLFEAASRASRGLIALSRLRNTGAVFPEHVRNPKNAYVRGRNDGFRDEITRNRESGIARTAPIILDPGIPNNLTIIDIDYSSKDDPRRKPNIDLYFVPRELKVTPAANFVGLATIGRNNPLYQFTGAEDSLEFEIDWHAQDQNKTDVIANCNWIKALTRSDGWNSDPHRIMIAWGSNPLLFKNDIWIVDSAPYTLSQFHRAYRSYDHYDENSKNYRNGDIIDARMLPVQARQTINLKKVSTYNLSTPDILQLDDLYPQSA